MTNLESWASLSIPRVALDGRLQRDDGPGRETSSRRSTGRRALDYPRHLSEARRPPVVPGRAAAPRASPTSGSSRAATHPDQAVKGDWDGDGDDTVGIYRGGVFYLENTNAAGSADLGYLSSARPATSRSPATGTGTVSTRSACTGPATAGWLLRSLKLGRRAGPLVHLRPHRRDPGGGRLGWKRHRHRGDLPSASDRQWYLQELLNSAGNAELIFPYGDPAMDIPVVGDWDGDGDDTVGIYRAALGEWFLKNANEAGCADLNFTYGLVDEKPLAGDWDGN
ncbi:MAG: hypothetical protein MZW92_14790 [Comamonadaceae bacterium]|nr:hypothetical protein [Comamonadaceae bacterium]